MIKRYRVFKVRHSPATNDKGSRIIIRDLQKNQTRIIGFYYPIYEGAQGFLKNKGIKCKGLAECDDCYYLFTDNFINEI